MAESTQGSSRSGTEVAAECRRLAALSTHPEVRSLSSQSASSTRCHSRSNVCCTNAPTPRYRSDINIISVPFNSRFHYSSSIFLISTRINVCHKVTARLEAWAAELEPVEPISGTATAEPVPLAKTPLTVKARPEVVLKQYAWDQTSDAVKIYVSIAGVGEPGANVEVSGCSDEEHQCASLDHSRVEWVRSLWCCPPCAQYSTHSTMESFDSFS